MTLKIANNDDIIKNEILNGNFNLDLSDHILHLKSFIDKDVCMSVMNSLDYLERDDSAPYTDGLLNDDADTYFDPDIKYIDNVRVPASYLNFYIANKIVLVPMFNDNKDLVVLKN